MGIPGAGARIGAAVLAIAGASLALDAEDSTPRRIEITARRYEYQPGAVEVTAGERVVLVLRSADVTHGLAIEALGVEVEIPRGGEPVSVELRPERPGTYRMVCSEYCGSGHRLMRGRLIVREAGGER